MATSSITREGLGKDELGGVSVLKGGGWSSAALAWGVVEFLAWEPDSPLFKSQLYFLLNQDAEEGGAREEGREAFFLHSMPRFPCL